MEAQTPGRSFLHDVILPKAEAISWLLTTLGFLARWIQLRGGDFLLLLGLGNLALVYFLMTFSPGSEMSESGNEFQPQAPAETGGSFYYAAVLPKLAMLGSAVTLIGALFKLLFWPGSTVQLLVGVGTLTSVVLAQVLRQQLNRRALLIGVLGGFMLYVPSETLIRQFHRNDPVLAEKMIYQLHHPRDRAAAEAVRQHRLPR